MDEDKTEPIEPNGKPTSEPTGPPPVKSNAKAKAQGAKPGTPIAVKGAGETEPSEPASKSVKVEDAEASAAAVGEPLPLNLPKNSVDEDLEAIDMSDGPANSAANQTTSDIEAESQAAPQIAPPSSQPGKPGKPSKPPKIKKPKDPARRKKIIKILIILLVVGALAGGAWWFMNRPQNQAATNQDNNDQSGAQNTSEPAEPEPPTIKTYTSQTLMVELSYPSNWKTTEKTNQVIFTSPEISYTTKDGAKTKDSFRLIIQKGFSQEDSTTINNAVAVKASELIKYTAPAKDQRSESYLSFLGPDKQTFTFIMITSGKEYAAGDTVAATLPLTQDSYLVFGGYGEGGGQNIDFDALSPDKILQDEAIYNQAVEIIKSLKING